MEQEKKIKKLKKETEKKLSAENSYQEARKALLEIEATGVKIEAHYNLQTIENMGKVIPMFANIKE